MANRLANATSPYLLQHADNPVDWWEWGEEAFAEARRRNVPILLSVGYAACHWCHVMAHESFEDEATAAYMNEHYVSIKVDREERPDVDAVYMQATVAMTGQGGWPMTCVLDHEGSPFFAGTYFPDQPRHGQPELPPAARGDRRRVDQPRRRGGGGLRAHPGGAGPVGRALGWRRLRPGRSRRGGDDAGARLRRGVGRLRGRAQVPAVDGARVPAAGADVVGMREPASGWPGSRSPRWRRGGIHDQLAGGFARYGVDRAWVVPHFEKMLYDNAQLLSVYARWALRQRRRAGRPGGARDRRFMLTELRHRRGCVRLRAGRRLRGRGGHLLRLDPRTAASRCSVPTTAPGRPRC